MTFHVAHVNIAWMHDGIDEPAMSGLSSRIDEINRLAEEWTGFVWRVPDSEASIEAFEVFRPDFPGFDLKIGRISGGRRVRSGVLRVVRFPLNHSQNWEGVGVFALIFGGQPGRTARSL